MPYRGTVPIMVHSVMTPLLVTYQGKGGIVVALLQVKVLALCLLHLKLPRVTLNEAVICSAHLMYTDLSQTFKTRQSCLVCCQSISMFQSRRKIMMNACCQSSHLICCSWKQRSPCLFLGRHRASFEHFPAPHQLGFLRYFLLERSFCFLGGVGLVNRRVTVSFLEANFLSLLYLSKKRTFCSSGFG